MDKQREILQALGWRLDHRKYDFDTVLIERWALVNPAGEVHEERLHKSEGGAWYAVDLSDPGTFWPMFRDFVSQNRLQYRLEFEWQQWNNRVPSWKCTVYAMFSKEWKFALGQVCGLSSTNETEAGISAWHSALVAMGKMSDKERREVTDTRP